MNKEIAIQLNDTVQRIKDYYSDPNRDCNYNNEQFTIDKIIPTSDQTAIVIFAKSGGKKALAFFYYINKGVSAGWKYFFPTDSHITGLRAIEFYKYLLEAENYSYNFSDINTTL